MDLTRRAFPHILSDVNHKKRGGADQSIRRPRSASWMNLLQLEAAVKHKRTERVVFYEHLLLHSVMTMHAVTRANDTID